jgi:hypothetical protein
MTVPMRVYLAFLVVVGLAFGLAACGEAGSEMGTGYTDAVRGLHSKCVPHEGLQAFTVLTDGGHGAVSGFLGVCKDGTAVAVND